MAVVYRYSILIVVPEAEQPAFHTQLINMLNNAKTSGKIVSAKGSYTKADIPEEIDIS